MAQQTDWQSYYQSHLTNPIEALRASLSEGCNIVVGHAAATPDTVLESLKEHIDELPQGNLFHVLYYGAGHQFTPEVAQHMNLKINFLEAKGRAACREGLVDFYPCHFHEVPALFSEGFYPVDVAIVQLSRPNAEGYCSFGISCDYTKPAAEAARIVIAEVNEQMPFIGGDNLIHVSKLHHIIEVNSAVPEVPPAEPGELERKIGEICASIIKDGDTLQLGIGAIPDAVLSNLTDRKNLGIHSEMITDGVMKLMKAGVITGAEKSINKGKVVTTFIMGSKELYDFIDHNEAMELYPVNYTNDPFVVGSIDNMVTINSCLEVDLLGQVNAESVGYNMLSGSGGQVDFMRGAKRSKGGRSILAFASTAKGGTISRIVPTLAEGAPVTTGRNDIDFVVTEWGMARLRGKTAKERARALIEVAHPDFREMLTEAARKRFKGF